jgi:RNA polymerase sigma-B factor
MSTGLRVAGEDRPYESRSTEWLFRRWRTQDDRAARDQIVRRYLPLARRLAGRYWNSLEPFDDLFQVTSTGLVLAMQRFDPDRGIDFKSFAIPTMLGEVKRHFRSTGWTAHVPRGAQELAWRVETASRQLSARTGRAPSVAELAAYLEVDAEDVLTGLDAAAAHFSVSLEAPVTRDPTDDTALVDRLGGEDERLALVELRLTLADGMRGLTRPEQRALELRITQELKQSEIAERLGCSQMHVSRLLRAAAAKLRQRAGM